MKELMTILTIAIVGVSVLLTGCDKKSSPPSEPSSSEHDMAAMAEEAEGMAGEAMDTAETAVGEAVTEQKTCPVMGGPIDKDVFVEYKGKKVYFCCPGCEDTFLKDPEKHISKLPQLQE